MNTRNNKLKLIMIIIISIVIGALAIPLFAQDAPSPAVKAEGAGVSFELRLLGDEVEVTLKAKTEGWVAFGLDPSRRMRDAGMVIAYVKDGKAYARDDYGTSDIAHRSDVSLGGTDDVISVSGSESGGVTTIVLRLPNQAKDAKDKSFAPGKHRLILARGSRDDFESKHVAASGVDIEIPGKP